MYDFKGYVFLYLPWRANSNSTFNLDRRGGHISKQFYNHKHFRVIGPPLKDHYVQDVNLMTRRSYTQITKHYARWSSSYHTFNQFHASEATMEQYGGIKLACNGKKYYFLSYGMIWYHIHTGAVTFLPYKIDSQGLFFKIKSGDTIDCMLSVSHCVLGWCRVDTMQASAPEKLCLCQYTSMNSSRIDFVLPASLIFFF